MTDDVLEIDKLARRVEQASNEGQDTIRMELPVLYALLRELRALQTAVMPFAAAAKRDGLCDRHTGKELTGETLLALSAPVSAYKKCMYLMVGGG